MDSSRMTIAFLYYKLSYDPNLLRWTKNPLKIFPGTERPITLKLGMQLEGLWPYQVCSNDDLWLALTYFTYVMVKFSHGKKKGETEDFYDCIVVFDIKVDANS